jgi:two-component system, sensor histidine kinase and response regulator
MSKPKILIVDDQPANIMLLQRKLEKEGLDVMVAFNGKQCLQLCEGVLPDIILLDVMMPEMDGIETCQLLKANPRTQAVPVLFITAKNTKEGKLEGLNVGAVDYITKPIDLDETLARVNTQLKVKNLFEQNLRLQQKLSEARQAAAIGAITEGIAHNLNNLMGVVVGYLDLLKADATLGDTPKRRVGLIDVAVQKIVKIVSTLTTISVNESVPLTQQPIHPILSTSLARWHAEYKLDAPVELTDQTSSATVATNQEILENVLGKLLMNAYESYPESATVRPVEVRARLGSENNQELLFIDVLDRGQGLDPAVAQQVFDPFISGKPDVGRGLGLTLARHLIRCMGGDLTVANRPEGGVVATITHPLAPAPKNALVEQV